MKKDTIINIKPFHAELVRQEDDGSFQIWFYDNVGNDYQRRKIVKIHFEGWWLRFIAQMLWKVQRKSKSVADQQASALRGEE